MKLPQGSTDYPIPTLVIVSGQVQRERRGTGGKAGPRKRFGEESAPVDRVRKLASQHRNLRVPLFPTESMAVALSVLAGGLKDKLAHRVMIQTKKQPTCPSPKARKVNPRTRKRPRNNGKAELCLKPKLDRSLTPAISKATRFHSSTTQDSPIPNAIVYSPSIIHH